MPGGMGRPPDFLLIAAGMTRVSIFLLWGDSGHLRRSLVRVALKVMAPFRFFVGCFGTSVAYPLSVLIDAD
jgi:hypothetical protein